MVFLSTIRNTQITNIFYIYYLQLPHQRVRFKLINYLDNSFREVDLQVSIF